MKRKKTPTLKGKKKSRPLSEVLNRAETVKEKTSSIKLEQHILNFSKLAQKRSQSDIFANVLSLSFLHNDDNDGNGENSVQESIEYFSSFLEKEQNDESSITKCHVASLIFPWITSSLIQKQGKASLSTWKAFTLCLEMLLSGNYDPISDCDEKLDVTLRRILEETKAEKIVKSHVDASATDIVSTVLSQGTMNKLVACFLRVSFLHSQKGTEQNAVRMAGKCFGLIVTSEFFRPTVDYVCNDILPLLHQLVGEETKVLPDQAAIIYLSIQLLIVLQRKGRATNPKKTFQLVSTSKTVSSLAKFSSLQVVGTDEVNILCVVKDLLWFALFDEFHMDEFRSMKLEIPVLDEEIQRKGAVGKGGKNVSKKKEIKKKDNDHAHSSYQQTLFKSLDNLLHESSSCKIVALFIPLLMEGFICQSLETDKNSTKKRSRVDLTAKIQFRFWSTLVFPMLEIIKQDRMGNESTRLALIQSMEQCTELLIKYDVYLPSFEDPDNEHLNYLVAMGEVILESTEKHKKDVAIYVGTLRRLFSLNHHVYHEKISRLIMCTNRQNEVEKNNETKDLVCILCTTYQKLRQLGHFVTNVLTCADICRPTGGCRTREGPKSFVHEISFSRAMTSAIQNSPIGQTEEVLGLIDQHIVDAVNSSAITANSVDIFVIILKALRVGPFSSTPIKDMCERTMSRSVATLFGLDVDMEADNTSSFDLTCSQTSSGLHLWGWIVHVHNKCCFWLNEMPHEKKATNEEDNNMCGRALVPRLMASINCALESDVEGGKSLEALQLLACHKLQQLHSSIFQKQQLEDLADIGVEEDEESKGMIEEASALVNFMIHSANNRSGGWKIICENLNNWIPYAKDDHVDSFLRWFFFTLAAHNDKEEADCTIRVPGLDEEVSAGVFSEEVASATALLRDASFYETPRLFDSVARVGYNCVSLLLFPDLTQSPLSTLNDIAQVLMTRTPKGPDLAMTNVIGATNVLKQLTLVLSTCGSLEGMLFLFGNILRVHVYAAQIFDCDEEYSLEEYTNVARLISTCRQALSDILSMIDASCKLLNGNLAEMVLTFTLRTTKTIIRCIGNEDEFLISSSAVLFSAIAVRCVSSIDTFPEIIDAWVPALENELGDVTDPCQEESIMLVKMLRPSMNVFLQALESSSAKGLQLALKNIVKAARPMTEYCIQAIHSRLSSNQDEIYLHVLADCMYFMADAIFIEHTLCEEHVESTITARGPIGEVLRTVMERLSNPEVCNNTGLLYLFGTFIGRDYLVGRSTVEMMLRVQGIFVEQCKASNFCIHPIISSSYAKLLHETKAEELATLANGLLQLIKDSDGVDRISTLAAVVHCFHVMANVVKGHAEREVLSAFGRKLLPKSSDLIYPFAKQSLVPYERWKNQILSAQGFMNTIIGKNDLIVLKGWDVSIILQTINIALASPEISTEYSRFENDMYSTSCKIVVSLLKHYPKQLYGCTPSLTSALRCLLNHSMRVGSGKSEIFEEFRKVCELLPEHKDVFKKHIMHLILFYVDGIQMTIDTSTKAQLEPSIFLLLGTLSDFETKQLNTLMRPAAKPLFQTVFKNYQKHQYKGQY